MVQIYSIEFVHMCRHAMAQFRWKDYFGELFAYVVCVCVCPRAYSLHCQRFARLPWRWLRIVRVSFAFHICEQFSLLLVWHCHNLSTQMNRKTNSRYTNRICVQLAFVVLAGASKTNYKIILISQLARVCTVCIVDFYSILNGDSCGKSAYYSHDGKCCGNGHFIFYFVRANESFFFLSFFVETKA